MCVIFVCSFVSPVSSTQAGLSLVFGQVGLTIDWNWTSQDRGVFSCTCTFCVCVCVCVCVVLCVCPSVCHVSGVQCMCAYLCVFNISACFQVGLNGPSIIKLDLSSKKNYVSVENMCMHLCALGMCEFVHVIALLVMQSQRVYGFVPRK